MRRLSLASLCLLGVLDSGPVLSAEAVDAQAWLNRLAEAQQHQSFHGTFIYERNGSFSTHAIWRRVEKSGQLLERLLQLDGLPHEVVRANGQVQCAHGNLAGRVAGAEGWPVAALDARQLAGWYDLQLVGESRVAGRSATVLMVTPRDQHRYGYELHLDAETGLPLKSLLLSDKGQLLERLQFTRLDISEPLAQALQPSSTCRPVSEVPGRAESAAQAWHSEWLPPGFRLDTTLDRSGAASDEPVVWLMYGDGLARFSVFLEPLRGASVSDGRSQFGPTAAVSRRLSTVDGDVMVTVVGEIPLGTAERVAMSMRAGQVSASP